MLSISPLKSASGAAKYYLGEENPKDLPDITLEKGDGDNYYLKEADQPETTFWHGKLAEDVNLTGKPVEKETLESVLSGHLGQETIKGKRANHKSGFDLTFSAPKSISILALAGGETRLIDAHNSAVKFALAELEKDVAQVKVTHEKGVQEYEDTDAMMFAVIRHKTSRENDMQLHSHALAANMTRDQAGELRALSTCLKQKGGVINGAGERIYYFQKYYTSLYQSHLAKSAENLGFCMRGVGNGQFEVTGVPESLIDAFSTRKKQIDQQALGFGNTQTARDTAALDTRKAKTYHSHETLNHQWQAKIQEHGHEPTQLVVQAQHTSTERVAPSPQEAKAAIHRAVEHLGQYKTTLHIEKIIEIAAADFTFGKTQLNALDLKQATDELIKSGQLIALQEKGQYTSKALLDNERALMDVTQGRAHHMRTHVNPGVLNQLNASHKQQQILTEVYQSTKQFHIVNVHGDSKPMTQQLLNVGHHSHKRVHLVSPNAREKQDSMDSIQRQSHTLSAWASQLFSSEHRHTTHSLLNGDLPLTNKDVLLIDEANTLSANELLGLTEKAKQSNSKVVMLNRVTNRQGFKAHNAIELYRKGHVESHTWVNGKSQDSQVTLHQSDTQRLARVYADLPDKDQTQVLATSGVEQRRLTEAIRTQLKNTHALSRIESTLFTQVPHFLSKTQQPLVQHYKPGMILTQWESKQPHRFVIASIDKESNTMTAFRQQDGQSVRFDPSSSDFKNRRMQLTKPDSLNVAVGERIKAVSHHKAAGLIAHQSYRITALDKDTITLENQGQTKSLPLNALKDTPLNYDYVHTASHIQSKSHTLLSAKAFTLSKPLLTELTEKSARIDVFTDNMDKAHHALGKTQATPSAIERIMAPTPVNDRYLSDRTSNELKQDVNAALSALSREQNAPIIEKAVSFALNHLSDREAAFSQKSLVIEAVRYAFEEAGTSITKSHIETELAKRSDTLSAQYSDGTRWTTQAALDTEKHILRNIDQGKNQHPSFASAKQVAQYLADRPRLTEGQKGSVTLISTTKDSVVAIQGLAGTGKSTMLESNIELIQSVKAVNQEKAQTVIGLAPTHAAVSELESKGVNAQTLESLLTELRQGNRQPSDYQDSLFFLDESSMVSNKQAKEFTDLILASGSKAVLLGDKEQLLSLSAGKPFELAMSQGRIDSADMTDIVRQQNDTLLNAAQNTIDKQPDSALDKLQKQAPDTQGKTQNVISTLNEHTQNKRQAQLEATAKLPYVVAKDYLERTPETREHTLIIAYTNAERDDITEHIRSGLIKNGELGKESIVATRLRSVGATGEELSTMMPYQKGLILSTKPGEYATITGVDSEHGIVTLQRERTGKTATFLPRNRDHTFTTLFSVSEKPLSTGDKIVTRFTDKARDIKANVEYRITHATPEAILAQSSTGQSLTINPSTLQDGHWDYAYSRTADMAQGATYPHVITAIKSKGALTNLRRAGIDVTRASQHIRLYTDNTEHLVKTWLSKESHKSSALETIEQTPPTNTVYFNRNALPHEDTRFQNASGDFDYQKFKTHINETLPKYTESLAEALLGAPNRSKSDRDYLTFGIGQSAIKVSLTGSHRGYFKDYTTGEKGSLVNLMMSHKDIGYKEAMNMANSMINAPGKHQLSENPNHDKLLNTTPRKIAQFEERAKAYIKQSQPINDSLVQTYLNKLGVNNIENEHVKYHPSVYSSEDKALHPAMLTNIHDKHGETRAVEITYLDSSGNKDNTLDINPRILGTKSKQFTQFHQGEHLNATIISTSIEQSFLIREETQGNIDIIHVNHKNDIQNLSTDELRQNVMIVLSQGNQDLNPNNIEKIMENFSGRDITFIAEDDLHRDIQSCLHKLDNVSSIKEEEVTDILKDEHSQRLEIDELKERKAQDSQALDYFDNSNLSQQKESISFEKDRDNSHEDREIEKELER
ncbi:conjugative transfer relaxase/helicase TraI (plasmid) [Vibrio sp. nBUS_14]|uniref:conjugative transfer relaxase/helicase TraI n=1 Tax=Vibrio sp. nBUS_14 TaxID=3395321 RepID=UPI003EBB3278